MELPGGDSPQRWPGIAGVLPGRLDLATVGLSSTRGSEQPGQLQFVRQNSFSPSNRKVVVMHRLPSSTSAVLTAVGTLVLIAITVVISDIVAASDVTRDVMRATGTQLIVIGSSAWQKRWANRKIAQACVVCGGTVGDSGSP